MKSRSSTLGSPLAAHSGRRDKEPPTWNGPATRCYTARERIADGLDPSNRDRPDASAVRIRRPPTSLKSSGPMVDRNSGRLMEPSRSTSPRRNRSPEMRCAAASTSFSDLGRPPKPSCPPRTTQGSRINHPLIGKREGGGRVCRAGLRLSTCAPSGLSLTLRPETSNPAGSGS